MDIINHISTYPAGSVGQELTKSSETTNQQGLVDVQLRLGNIPSEYKVTAICNDCIPEQSSVTFTCCGKLQTTNYRQGDPRWGNEILGSNPPTYFIRQTGCALTSVANLINFYAETDISINKINPLILNKFLFLVEYITKMTIFYGMKSLMCLVIFDLLEL